MSRLVLCLPLMCALPTVSFAQERPAETRAASSGDETYRSSGGDMVVVASGGLRVQGHYGRLVPHAQVLIGLGAARTF